MKKTLTISLLATTLATPAFAEIDTILYYKPGGSFDRLLTVIEESLGDEFGQRIITENCAATKEYLSSASNPTITMWSPEFQIQTEDGSPNPCAAPDDIFVGALAAAPFMICHKDGDSQASTLNHLKNGNIRLGAYYTKYNMVPLSAVMSSLNPNSTVIPYKSSTTYRPALQSGELDYIITTSVKDGEKCIATFGENTHDGLPTVNSMIDHPFNVFTYTYTVVGTNLSDPDSIIPNVHASDAWANRKDQKYVPFLTGSSRAEQLDWQTTFNNGVVKGISETN